MVMFNIKNVKKISLQKIKDFKIYILKKLLKYILFTALLFTMPILEKAIGQVFIKKDGRFLLNITGRLKAGL